MLPPADMSTTGIEEKFGLSFCLRRKSQPFMTGIIKSKRMMSQAAPWSCSRLQAAAPLAARSTR